MFFFLFCSLSNHICGNFRTPKDQLTKEVEELRAQCKTSEASALNKERELGNVRAELKV